MFVQLKKISKNYIQKFLIIAGCAGSFLLGMDQKYIVDVPGRTIAMGLEKAKAVYPITVLTKNSQDLVKVVTFDQPIKSWEWDKTGKPILHVTSENNEIHSFKIEQLY